MTLVLAPNRRGNLELRPTRLFRSLLALIPLIMGAAVGSSLARGDGAAVGPMIFLFLSGGAALYEERWIFRRELIESRLGLLFLYRRRKIAVSTVEAVTLSSFTKGRLRGTDPHGPSFLPSFAVLSLGLTDDKPVVIEITRLGKREQLQAKATRIGASIAKPVQNQL